MKNGVKELSRIMREIYHNSDGDSSALVLDTGGLIDILSGIRGHNLSHRATNRDSNYILPSSFLRKLSEITNVIITPETYKEIYNHRITRLNRHSFEIPPQVVKFSLDAVSKSTRFMWGLELQLGLDDIRYDAYWASKECCRHNQKKHDEGFSEADKEILVTAACLSNSKTENSQGSNISPVIVVSSDSHVIRGSEFLKRECGERYENIVPISTRY